LRANYILVSGKFGNCRLNDLPGDAEPALKFRRAVISVEDEYTATEGGDTGEIAGSNGGW